MESRFVGILAGIIPLELFIPECRLSYKKTVKIGISDFGKGPDYESENILHISDRIKCGGVHVSTSESGWDHYPSTSDM
jgi:hypothetical protein